MTTLNYRETELDTSAACVLHHNKWWHGKIFGILTVVVELKYSVSNTVRCECLAKGAKKMKVIWWENVQSTMTYFSKTKWNGNETRMILMWKALMLILMMMECSRKRERESEHYTKMYSWTFESNERKGKRNKKHFIPIDVNVSHAPTHHIFICGNGPMCVQRAKLVDVHNVLYYIFAIYKMKLFKMGRAQAINKHYSRAFIHFRMCCWVIWEYTRTNT